jgi:hypothetical protein
MALNNAESGFFAASEYMVSPLPWVISGSTSATDVVKYSFPKVSKNIIVINNATVGKLIRIGFSENGVNGVVDNHYIAIDGKQTINLDVRVRELFLRADTSNTINFSVYAGLTTINSAQMPTLSGSLPDGSTGWTGVG